VVADETDEDGARAARMDDWIVWEAEEEVARRTPAFLVGSHIMC